jgi:hypothetical protein
VYGRRLGRIDADQRDRADGVGRRRIPIHVVGRQVDGAAEDHRDRPDAVDGRHPRGDARFESVARPQGDAGVHLAGGGQRIGLEGAGERRQHRVHAEDHQHSEDDGERGEHRAQLAAP